MVKKLSSFENEQQKRQPGNGEYYFISLPYRDVLVSRTMAVFIEEQLNRLRKPKWITFVDIFGSRIRVQTKVIWSVTQSNGAQRAAGRAFDRACQREYEADD